MVVLALCFNHGVQAASNTIEADRFTLAYQVPDSWGTPTVSAGVISFPGIQFAANGSGEYEVNASVTLTLTAKPGVTITSLDWLAGGTYNVTSETAHGFHLLAEETLGLPALGMMDSFAFDRGTSTAMQGGPASWDGSVTLERLSPLADLTLQIDATLSATPLWGTPDLSISQDFAELHVTTVPLPPAVLLFGSTLAGLMVLSRRRAV